MAVEGRNAKTEFETIIMDLIGDALRIASQEKARNPQSYDEANVVIEINRQRGADLAGHILSEQAQKIRDFGDNAFALTEKQNGAVARFLAETRDYMRGINAPRHPISVKRVAGWIVASFVHVKALEEEIYLAALKHFGATYPAPLASPARASDTEWSAEGGNGNEQEAASRFAESDDTTLEQLCAARAQYECRNIRGAARAMQDYGISIEDAMSFYMANRGYVPANNWDSDKQIRFLRSAIEANLA